MVIQRGVPVHVWGMASPQENVTVTFRGETKSTNADELGRWSLYLAPGEAGGPFAMTVKSTNTITLNDVLVGDVWVASGQSNMEFPMKELLNADAEIAGAQYPKIRIFRVEHRPSSYPDRTSTHKRGRRARRRASRTRRQSLIISRAIFIRKTMYRSDCWKHFWGGTPAESWTSLRGLSADASLMPVFAERTHMVEEQETTVLRLQKEDRDLEQAAVQAKAEGKPVPGRPWHPDFDAWAPAALFNGMVAPLTRFPIRGVIWYQGEANAGRTAALYGSQLRTLIGDWRREWDVGDFPFLIRATRQLECRRGLELA